MRIGLETAISHLVHEQRRHGGPTIECHSNVQIQRLPSILENALYRIAQEALTNACKHSKSKKVTVTMAQEGQEVRLEVRDWGIGFDPDSVKRGTLWRRGHSPKGATPWRSADHRKQAGFWNPGSGRCAHSGKAGRRIGWM